MNNPACTVCHQTMDPVAGAFQNFDELGVYRPHWDGDPDNPAHRNALPSTYKYGDDSDWEPGESWFRDMRVPGFNGKPAPSSDTSLAWLAEQMANDPRFAVGAVEFWWPAVMGHEVLRAPDDPSLPGYSDNLMAFNLQRSEIGRLASVFSQSGFRLKEMLKEMVRSKWFNAVAMAEGHSYGDVLAVAGIGARRLLTPEELQAKTQSAVGITIDYKESDWILPTVSSYLDTNRIAMGGIDSYQVQTRARSLSAVGSAVSATHGASVACAISQIDRVIVDGNRLLLNGVDFREPVSDTPMLRDILTDIYARLHGKSYSSESAEIDLMVELLLEAYHVSGGCYSWDRERLIDEARARGDLAEDPDRNMNNVERSNTRAWQLALDFMFSHFDYTHE